MRKLFMSLVILMFLMTGVAWGTPISGTALQDVLNSITVAPSPTPGTSSVNVNTDQVAFDSYWSITGAGGSIATIVVELGSYAPSNTFGVYDATDSTRKVEIFSGTDIPGAQASISIAANGSVFVKFVDTGTDFGGNLFGFYLQSPDGIFYSDAALNPEALNPDQKDHFVAFQGQNIDTVQLPGWSPGLWTNNEYVFGWEDLYGLGDKDYEDMVIMVESVNPVPEPAAMLLLGFGLVGLAGIRRKIQK